MGGGIATRAREQKWLMACQRLGASFGGRRHDGGAARARRARGGQGGGARARRGSARAVLELRGAAREAKLAARESRARARRADGVNDSLLLSADDATVARCEFDARTVARAAAFELDLAARVRTRSSLSSAVRRARQSSWRASREPSTPHWRSSPRSPRTRPCSALVAMSAGVSSAAASCGASARS